MTSELRVDKIHNEGGDNDSGLDMSTNDVVAVKIAGAEKARIHSDGSLRVDTINNQSGDNDSGINLATNDTIKFDIAGSTKVTVDADGSVGIGVADGDVTNDGTAARTYVGIIGTANRGRLNIGSTAHDGADGGVVSFVNGANQLGNIYMDTNSGVQNAGKMYINSTDELSIIMGGTVSVKVTSSGQLVLTVSKDDTTSDSANANIRSSDGLVRRSTSSLRYKNSIKDATHGLAELMKLRSVTYKGNNDGDIIFGGLIAEEVHDAGLTEFVDYDTQDRPDSLKYTHMVALCVKAIQELSAKNDTLETQVADLITRVKALEAK